MSSAALLGLVFTLGTATAAFAFSAQPGFSATTYASGYPAGGPAGVAFIGTTMYTADPTDGGLYSTATSGTLVRVGTIPGAPTGLAAFGTTLYAIQSATKTVVQVDPANGAVLATLGRALEFEGHPISGIASDPVTGDLYVSAAQGFIYTIPAVAPRTPAFWIVLNGQPATFGIAVAPDRQVYVAVEGLGSDGVRQITTSKAQSPIGPVYTGARGVGVIPGYIFVNNADGSITKIVIPGVGAGTTSAALTGGAAGGFAGIGSDGCFYASQGAAVIRLAQTDGTCTALGSAGPPPPPATLTLVNTSVNLPLIGNGDQTFTATFANVANAANIAVTFTVTRGLSSTTYAATTGPNGSATFGYTPATPGIDTVIASAVINANPIRSNAVSVNWPRAVDTAKPTITYTVTGGHNAGPAFSCPSLTQGTVGIKEYCGWYTTPPTVHFTITPNGPSLLDTTLTCPDYTLLANSPSTGTPVTCNAQNGDGRGLTALTVVLQALITPPTITVSASTPSGPYVSGPTNQNVTVTFVCASDPAFGPTAISICTPPVTLSTESAAAFASGSVVDIAGTTRSTTFGPVFIDKTAPSISVVATLRGGGVYTYGAWTSQNVTLTYRCADAGAAPSGIASCPATTTFSAIQPAFIATARDIAGNVASVSVGPINIDKTPPTIVATATAGAVPYAGIAPTNQTVTVTFTCGTDGAPVTCPAPISYPAEGTFTATGTAIDAAGNAASAAFGPFSVDKTPPTISVIATLPGGAVYPYGAWTRSDVTLTYACADTAGVGPSGIASCPANTTISAKQVAFQATATDKAGNTATVAVGPINIDKTPPTITAAATVGGVAYLGTTATVGPVIVTFTCATDGAPVTCPAAVTYATPGTFTATATATDAAGNSATASFGPFTILSTQPSTLTITSLPRLPQGATNVTAKLLGPGGAPIVGRTVKFAAGILTVTGVSNASGIASATLVLKPGSYTLTASFAGDTSFLASSTSSPLVVFARENGTGGGTDGTSGGRGGNGDGKDGTGGGKGGDGTSGGGTSKQPD